MSRCNESTSCNGRTSILWNGNISQAKQNLFSIIFLAESPISIDKAKTQQIIIVGGASSACRSCPFSSLKQSHLWYLNTFNVQLSFCAVFLFSTLTHEISSASQKTNGYQSWRDHQSWQIRYAHPPQQPVPVGVNVCAGLSVGTTLRLGVCRLAQPRHLPQPPILLLPPVSPRLGVVPHTAARHVRWN